MVTKTTPLVHAAWPKYSTQALEKASEENRLEALLTELANEILTDPNIPGETKFETGCRAICMIPPQQSALIKTISTAFKAQGFWEMAKSSWPMPKGGYNHVLVQSQEEAVKRKNLPAALKLISKSEFVKQSLIKAVLDHLPHEKLVRSVARRDLFSFSSWFETLSIEDERLLFDGGYRFIDPYGRENSAILDIFKTYDEERRQRLFQIAPQLITPCDEIADLKAILKALIEIDPTQQAECAQAAALLCYDGLSGADKVAIIKAVAGLPAGRRISLCEAASMLNLRSYKLRKARNKLAKQVESSIKKSVVQGLSEKNPDTFSYKRVIAILESLVKLDSSLFSEKVDVIKLHLDASQLLKKDGHLEQKAVCDLIKGVGEGTFSPPAISQDWLRIQDTDRESVLNVYWKRFADVPDEDRTTVLNLLAQISESNRKFVSDFFKVKRLYSECSSYPSQTFGKGYGYNNPKKDVLEAIVSIPPGEVEEVLRSTKSLMDLFKDQEDHTTYIGVLTFVRKGNRAALVEKLSQMRQWKSKRKSSEDQRIFLGLLALTSKLSADAITQEIFDILFRFEEGPEHAYRDQPQLVKEILELPPELFSGLSFCYVHGAIDLLGQEGLKRAVEIAQKKTGSYGPKITVAIVKKIILDDPSIKKQMLERLRFRLEKGESKIEMLLAAAMIVELFAKSIHDDETLALEATSKAKPELSSEEAIKCLHEEVASLKKETEFSLELNF